METMSYYVTPEGLAAAVVNADIHQTLRGILMGRAHPSTVKSFLTRKLIAKELRKAPRTDNNVLVVTGALDRLREVLRPQFPLVAGDGNGSQPAAKPKVGPTRYVAQAPEPPRLSPTEQLIYDTVQRIGVAGVTDLKAAEPKIAAMNVGTLRWAIQQLRRKGLLQSQKEGAAA